MIRSAGLVALFALCVVLPSAPRAETAVPETAAQVALSFAPDTGAALFMPSRTPSADATTRHCLATAPDCDRLHT